VHIGIYFLSLAFLLCSYSFSNVLSALLGRISSSAIIPLAEQITALKNPDALSKDEIETAIGAKRVKKLAAPSSVIAIIYQNFDELLDSN